MHPEKKKYCPECGLYKPTLEFKKLTTSSALRKSPDGYSRACTPCFKEKVFVYSEADAPSNRKARRRDKRARRIEQVATTYGLSEEDYLQMIDAQGNKCAICEQKKEGKVLCVDHDHKSGKVRGLLCHNCNVGLGNFKDDPKIIVSAIGYLQKYQEAVAAEKPLPTPEKE